MADGESVFPKVPEQDDIRKFLFEDSEKKVEAEPVKVEAPKIEEPKVEAPVVAEAEPEEKKELPFHKHPRFKRIVDENKKMAEELESLKKAREQVSAPVAPTLEEVPAVYKELFGDNADGVKKLQALLRAEARKEAEQFYKQEEDRKGQQKQAEEARSKKAVDYALNELAELTEETGIDMTDEKNTLRNQILNHCAKYNFSTPEGLPNIRAAYENYMEIHPATSPELEEKKKVLGKTVTKTNSQAKEDTVMTPKRLKEIEKQGGLGYLWGLHKT